MHHLCVYGGDVSVILMLNRYWKYSCDMVTLSRRLETETAASGVGEGQYRCLKMNLVFYFSGECEGKLHNLLSACEQTGSLKQH